MFNFFEELFAPGRRHAADEQKRLELSRVDFGVGDPGRGPIDLSSGKVTVRAPDTDPGTGGPPEPGPRRMRPTAPEQDAVLDRPRPGRPVSGPERGEDEEH
ncbi:DUF6191 domain-containing protein [Streptomyces sp. C11-1]|uniref:DUF6191 domain-containing protein n=1 Tax=Streptomyces durocortorensis TaxID=2811104 RepID=A0ABY9W4I6_9ACTN|nr:DUF6191 domain-containing protein [Streptomyces durocortorensis]WNF29770.1 DUF6191 domain-containing protein [Streptomyces durocortorensis]